MKKKIVDKKNREGTVRDFRDCPRFTCDQELKLFSEKMALTVISTKGCPYGDRLRLFLDKIQQKYELGDKMSAENTISGTLSIDGNLSNDIIEVLTFFNVIQTIPDGKRERHLKLADKFETTIIRYESEITFYS